MKNSLEKIRGELKSKRFFKIFVFGSAFYLLVTLLFIGLGLMPNWILQTVAGIVQFIAFIVMFVQILLMFWNSNRDDSLGHKVTGVAYISLFAMLICTILIVVASFLNSFYPNPGSNPTYAPMLSIFALGICFSFGIFASMACYMALSEDSAWNF